MAHRTAIHSFVNVKVSRGNSAAFPLRNAETLISTCNLLINNQRPGSGASYGLW